MREKETDTMNYVVRDFGRGYCSFDIFGKRTPTLVLLKAILNNIIKKPEHPKWK